jgi:U3 small nucleolar RNA-associated protein 21
VAVSACGTFALVGSAGGCIDMFNLQSGLHRQRFPPAKSSKTNGAKPSSGSEHLAPENGLRGSYIHRDRHTKAVTGLAVDGLNRRIISCGLDGKLKVRSWIIFLKRFSTNKKV